MSIKYLLLSVLFITVISNTLTAQQDNNSASGEVVSVGKSVLDKVRAEGRMVETLKETDLVSLPLGISKEINGKSYVIAIDSTKYTDGESVLSIYTEFTIPGTDRNLIFSAKNISFTPGSLSFTSGTRLLLENQQVIKINNKVDLVLPGNGQNYIEWDCNGFKAVNLKGIFKFDNGLLISARTGAGAQDVVEATFQLHANDINNMMASIDMTPFKIKGLKDFIFEVNEAVVDMSDMVNPQGLYLFSEDADVFGGDQNLWRGFFLKQLKVTLPPMYTKDNGAKPFVSANNIMIDDRGVTGSFMAGNLIKLGDAAAGGWPMSIETIEVQLVHNKVRGGSIGGKLNISLLGDEPLDYLAQIQDRDSTTYYAFTIVTNDNKKFGSFLGDITLKKNSSVKLEYYNDKFVGSAVLNGRVDISQKILKAPGVEFQELTVCTEKPYVRKGIFSVDGNINCKIAGYGIQFQNLTFGINQGQIALSSLVTLDLMNSGDKGFSCSAQVSVTAKQKDQPATVMINNKAVDRTRTKWEIDKVKVSAIRLEVNIAAFKLNGVINLYDDDPIYGNGFSGGIKLKMPVIKGEVKANVYFGNKTDSIGSFKYYHVDVRVPIKIPLFAGIDIRALTGGLSYRMERPADFDPFAVAQNNILTSQTDTAKNKTINLEPALFNYIPSRESGYGFLAGVTIATSDGSIITADLFLEIMLAQTGGLRYVQFDGSLYVMSPINLRGVKPKDDAGKVPLYAVAKMRYDNDNDCLHATCKTYMFIGGGVLKGVNERGLVGEMQLHYDPNDWWIYIGRPSQMFGVNAANLLTVKTYLQVGTRVEDMPPLPAEVGNILNMGNLDFMANENAMSTGKGFGFGLHFKASFGFGENGGFLYAFLKAGAGADILLRNYGTARCKGSGELGVNGWYASGQAYAFIEGKLGVRVKVFGKKRQFDIASLAAAAVLQAKLPNPSWFRGVVGVRYSILGGLVKGKASVKVELGTQCEILGSKEVEVEIIKDFLPEAQATAVSVFASPQVTFNLALEKPFKMMNNEDVVVTYKTKLDEYKFEHKNNIVIAGSTSFTEERDAINFTSDEILPPNEKIKGTIKLHLEKELSANNWVPVLENGAIMYEKRTNEFTTGAAPNNIPAENVAYTYPIHKQFNFFAKEYNKGYVTLKQGQTYLFNENAEGVQWKFLAHFESNDGQTQEVPLTYNSSTKTVGFEFPEGLLSNTVYRMGIIKTPLHGDNAAANVQSQTAQSVEDGDTTTITTKSLKGLALSANAVLYYQLAFRASKYKTFKEKMAALSAPQELFDISQNIQPIIGKRYDADEAFDKHDLEDGIATKSLLNIVATEDNNWLQNQINPLLYNDYTTFQQLGFGINYRPTALLGIKPLKGVKLHNNEFASFELEQNEMAEMVVPGKTGRIRFMYYLNHISNLDHFDMRNRAINNYINTGNSLGGAPLSVQALINLAFPEIVPNNLYKLKIEYKLPGLNTVTSTWDDGIMFR
jgi:hypothetical protein